MIVFRYRGNVAPLDDAVKEGSKWRQNIRHAPDDDALEARMADHMRKLFIAGRHIERDHHRSAGIIDLMLDLALGIKRVEIDGHAADFENREIEDQIKR